jgi:hypothetical protein
MATAKGTAKKVAKTVEPVEASLEPVVVGSPEWLAMKAEARARLDNL